MDTPSRAELRDIIGNAMHPHVCDEQHDIWQECKRISSSELMAAASAVEDRYRLVPADSGGSG